MVGIIYVGAAIVFHDSITVLIFGYKRLRAVKGKP